MSKVHLDKFSDLLYDGYHIVSSRNEKPSSALDMSGETFTLEKDGDQREITIPLRDLVEAAEIAKKWGSKKDTKFFK